MSEAVRTVSVRCNNTWFYLSSLGCCCILSVFLWSTVMMGTKLTKSLCWLLMQD